MVKNLLISGYRSYEMGLYKEDDERLKFIKLALKQRIINEIDRALEWVLISGQLGAEIWAGQLVLELKADYSQLHLGLILPYYSFAERWKESNQAALLDLKDRADFVDYTSKQHYQNPGQLQANQIFLIEHSQKALLLYDTDYPAKTQYLYDLILKRQEKTAYELEMITAFDLQDMVEEERLKEADRWQ